MGEVKRKKKQNWERESRKMRKRTRITCNASYINNRMWVSCQRQRSKSNQIRAHGRQIEGSLLVTISSLHTVEASDLGI